MTASRRPPSRTFLLVLFLCGAFAVSSCRTPAIIGNPQTEHRIDLFEENGQCLYEIEGQADQDTVVVEPIDWLAFVSRNRLLVSVSVRPDNGRRGLAGKNGENRFEGQWLPTIRGRAGRTTQHPIHIQCCLPAGSESCEYSDARSRRDLGNMGSLLNSPAEFIGHAWIGRSAPEEVPAEPLPRPGGPTMKVVE